jgi:hypothetical protein
VSLLDRVARNVAVWASGPNAGASRASQEESLQEGRRRPGPRSRLTPDGERQQDQRERVDGPDLDDRRRGRNSRQRPLDRLDRIIGNACAGEAEKQQAEDEHQHEHDKRKPLPEPLDRHGLRIAALIRERLAGLSSLGSTDGRKDREADDFRPAG